jgi:hypothetical protein
MKALRLPLSHVSKAFFISAAFALAAVVAPEAQASQAQTIMSVGTFFEATRTQPAGTIYDVAVFTTSGLPVTFTSGNDLVATVTTREVPSGGVFGGYEFPGMAVGTVQVVGPSGATTTITASQAGGTVGGIVWDAAASVSQQLTVAGGANANVGYGPYSANSEGGMPRSDAYNVRVYRPDGTSGAETIGFVVQPVQDPLNNPALTASFVYVTPSTVSFAAGELFKDVVVTCSIPTLNIPPGSTVKFVYKVLTSGWSVPVGDNGFALNATVTAPPPADSGPPVVVISQPSQLVYGPYAVGAVPAVIPLTFQALTAAPSTITSVDATITSTSFSSPQSRAITLTAGTHIVGLGSQTATATTTQMPIAGAGVYTVMAAGVDSKGRRTQATKTFTVVVDTPTPPTVVINSPTPGSIYVRTFGTNPWTIPFAFTANSPGGVIRTVSATLDNSSTPIVVTPVPFGLNVPTVTASANLNLNTGGVHTLKVTVTDSFGGTATTTGTFTINLLQATPTITWNDPAPITYGTSLSGTQLNATVSRGVRGTFTYTPASGMVLPAGTHTLSVTFTPADTVNYSRVTKTVQLTINPAPLRITADSMTVPAGVTPILSATYSGLVNGETAAVVSGVTLATTATATSPAGVVYPITVTGGTAANYAITRFGGTVTVTKASQTITFGALPAKNFGDRPFALTATASSGLTVSYTSSNPAVATVSGSTVTILRAGTTTITASQPGNATYSAALPVSRTLTVNAGANQPCAVLHWLPPISLDKEQQKGGSMLPIRFHLHLCCTGSGSSGDDDDSDDDHGDDDNGSKGKSSSAKAKSSSSKTSGGTSASNHVCDEDDRRDDDQHDGWKDNGNGHCPLLKDTTVIITVYEVGQPLSSAVHYTYSAKGNPKAPTYTIDGDKAYHLDFSTAKGVHRYHIDVDYYPNGATVPVLIDSKEFTTK